MDTSSVAPCSLATPEATGGAAGAVPATLMVVAWEDPLVDRIGFDVRSEYVDLFWLGVLGPTATWLLRHLVRGLARWPLGYEADTDELASMMGVGKGGTSGIFARSLHRCELFGVARTVPGALAVRRRVPPLASRQLARLPASVQLAHRSWQTHDGGDRHRADVLVAAFLDIGDEPEVIERHLLAIGIGPAVAAEAVSRFSVAS